MANSKSQAEQGLQLAMLAGWLAGQLNVEIQDGAKRVVDAVGMLATQVPRIHVPKTTLPKPQAPNS